MQIRPPRVSGTIQLLERPAVRIVKAPLISGRAILPGLFVGDVIFSMIFAHANDLTTLSFY